MWLAVAFRLFASCRVGLTRRFRLSLVRWARSPSTTIYPRSLKWTELVANVQGVLSLGALEDILLGDRFHWSAERAECAPQAYSSIQTGLIVGLCRSIWIERIPDTRHASPRGV